MTQPTNQNNSMPRPRPPGKFFTNPYNFVGWETPLAGKEKLQHRPYAPLDRYYGYSGRLECTLTTLTPFFVPTGQTEDQPQNGHKFKSFLRLPDPQSGEPKLAIQASSLKGMLRNIIETATNSCYAVFDPDKHYSYRPAPEPLPVGMVVKVEADGSGLLEKMESARLRYNELAKYRELAKSGDNIPAQQYAAARIVTSSRSSFLKNAEQLRPLKEGTTAPAGLTPGWIKATGEGLVETKRHERFVYRGAGELYRIPSEVVTAYNAVLEEQYERNGQGEKTFKTKLAHSSLTAGDIVYFKENNRPRGALPGGVSALGAVAVPRYQYKYELGQYLPKSLHPCEDYNALCPACRLFGWVRDAHREQQGQSNRANEAAVAGRIFFSHAYSQANLPERAPEKTLAVLSTPKPTTTPFYLINSKSVEEYVDYNQPPEPVIVRGRKFYWHYNPATGQYLQREKGDRSNLKRQNDQNSTVELLEENVEFTFSIDFVNLDEVELGMLLWAIEFEGADLPGERALRHKLGMGKALGLGTVHLQIQRLILHDRVTRYQAANLFEPPAQEQTASDCARFRDAFKKRLAEIFGLPFDDLLNIRELTAMLNIHSIANPSEVHYPYLPDSRNPGLPDEKNHENFRWFVANNRRLNRRRNTLPITLPTVEEEVALDSTARLPLNPRL